MASSRFLRGRKRRELTPLFILLFLSPYLIGWSPDPDSVYTYQEIRFGAGTGQYVYEDCSGVHTNDLKEVGASITRKYEGPYRLGISGTVFKDGDAVAAGAYPDIALDWKNFSIGTTGLRIGSREKFYWELAGLEGAPMLTGRGVIRSGFGGVFGEQKYRFFLGLNTVPYSHSGVILQYEVPYSTKRYLTLTGRFGRAWGRDEFALSVGLHWLSP